MTFVGDVGANMARWWWRLRRDPITLAVDLIQPILWLFLFGHLFTYARLGLGAHMSYLAFMAPGVVVMTMFNVAMAGGLELIVDRETGMLRRLLVTPSHRSALLTGRFLFVVALGLAQVAILLVAARVMGVALRADLPGVATVLVADVLLGSGVAIVSLVLAFTLKSHGPFYAVLGFVTLPVTFLSTAFAPLSTMAPWLRTIAAWNPLTYAVNASRTALFSHVSVGATAQMLGALILFDALALAIGLRVFQRALT